MIISVERFIGIFKESRRYDRAIAILSVFILLAMLVHDYAVIYSGKQNIRAEIQKDASVQLLFGEVKTVRNLPLESYFFANEPKYGSPLYFFVTGARYSGIVRRAYDGNAKEGKYIFEVETKPFVYKQIDASLVDNSSKMLLGSYLLSHTLPCVIYIFIVIVIPMFPKSWKNVSFKLLPSFEIDFFLPMTAIVVCSLLFLINVGQVLYVFAIR